MTRNRADRLGTEHVGKTVRIPTGKGRKAVRVGAEAVGRRSGSLAVTRSMGTQRPAAKGVNKAVKGGKPAVKGAKPAGKAAGKGSK